MRHELGEEDESPARQEPRCVEIARQDHAGRRSVRDSGKHGHLQPTQLEDESHRAHCARIKATHADTPLRSAVVGLPMRNVVWFIQCFLVFLPDQISAPPLRSWGAYALLVSSRNVRQRLQWPAAAVAVTVVVACCSAAAAAAAALPPLLLLLLLLFILHI